MQTTTQATAATMAALLCLAGALAQPAGWKPPRKPTKPAKRGPEILPEYKTDQCFKTIDPLGTRLATTAELQTKEAANILWYLERGTNRNHRKQWEFVYIVRALRAAGVLHQGARGLVFAAGREPTVSYFASLGAHIVATDMDPDLAVTAGWATTGQHSKVVQDLYRHYHDLSKRDFERRVSFQVADMNQLNTSWYGKYDFVWSTCSLEHVGSIALGKLFALKSMNFLRPGGVAVHTTEFTLSSVGPTVEQGSTVMWRRSDVEELRADLRGFGFEVGGACYGSGDHPVDQHIDLPPYNSSDHMRLQLMGHVATSVGWTARRPARDAERRPSTLLSRATHAVGLDW